MDIPWSHKIMYFHNQDRWHKGKYRTPWSDWTWLTGHVGRLEWPLCSLCAQNKSEAARGWDYVKSSTMVLRTKRLKTVYVKAKHQPGWVPQDLLGPAKDSGFYSLCKRESLRGLKQDSIALWFTFSWEDKWRARINNELGFLRATRCNGVPPHAQQGLNHWIRSSAASLLGTFRAVRKWKPHWPRSCTTQTWAHMCWGPMLCIWHCGWHSSGGCRLFAHPCPKP